MASISAQRGHREGGVKYSHKPCWKLLVINLINVYKVTECCSGYCFKRLASGFLSFTHRSKKKIIRTPLLILLLPSNDSTEHYFIICSGSNLYTSLFMVRDASIPFYVHPKDSTASVGSVDLHKFLALKSVVIGFNIILLFCSLL